MIDRFVHISYFGFLLYLTLTPLLQPTLLGMPLPFEWGIICDISNITNVARYASTAFCVAHERD